MKTFVVDLDKCIGCRNCQIGCKDEFCGNDWLPYSLSQPEAGQFWIKVYEEERGARPHIKVTYLPVLCQHCEDAPCIKAAKDDAVYRREDGLVIIDPIKSKGQRAIVDSCPYNRIFWNEMLQIPQKCTGCAHLLDGDENIKVPRCYDNCPTGAIQFGEEAELDLQGTESLYPQYGTKPRVRYRNLPKRFVAGTLYDPEQKEVIEGAQVILVGPDGSFDAVTDNYGDFWLKNLPEEDFTLIISYNGKTKEMQVSTKESDIGLGDIPFA